MSIFDLIFGTGKKAYSSTIEKIPASTFARQVRLTINGEKKYYSEVKLKNLLINLTRGGKTLTKLEEELKEMGAKNDQINRRKEIIEIIKAELEKNSKLPQTPKPTATRSL